MTVPLNVPIIYMPVPNRSLGRGGTVRAIVNHRMVGYLAGTDITFRDTARKVSSNFGIGRNSAGRVEIHQYVALDDTAWCNGDYQAGCAWQGWGYPVSNINAQTISIEHQDYGDPKGVGIVSEDIQQASIRLQALLLRGALDEWHAAGIVLRDWTNNAAILQRELRAIVPGPRTIITHHDIAGSLKPTCWLPWSADTVGFDRQKFINGINVASGAVPIPDTATEADMPALTQYIPGKLATVKSASNIRSAPAITGNTPLRAVPAGSTETWAVTGTVKGEVDRESGSDQWYVRWANGRWEYTAFINVTALKDPVDPALQTQVTALQGQVNALAAKLAQEQADDIAIADQLAQAEVKLRA